MTALRDFNVSVNGASRTFQVDPSNKPALPEGWNKDGAASYDVQSGDSMWSIWQGQAKDNGVSWSQFKDANPHVFGQNHEGNYIQAGQQVVIPGGTTAGGTAPTQDTAATEPAPQAERATVRDFVENQDATTDAGSETVRADELAQRDVADRASRRPAARSQRPEATGSRRRRRRRPAVTRDSNPRQQADAAQRFAREHGLSRRSHITDAQFEGVHGFRPATEGQANRWERQQDRQASQESADRRRYERMHDRDLRNQFAEGLGMERTFWNRHIIDAMYDGQQE